MPRANPDVNYEISIHALLAESDIDAAVEVAHIRNFYPRSPCGERPHSTKKQVEYWIISIHALLAESDGFGERACRRAGISIHVLLAESDAGA